MSKQILKKELVFLDFKQSEGKFYDGKFYHIEMLSVGYNQIQVISTYGNMNNKGRESIIRFKGKDAFTEAKKLFYKKFFDKKNEGYFERQDIEKWFKAFDPKNFEEHLTLIKKNHANFTNQEQKNTTKKIASKNSTISKKKSVSEQKKHSCDLCKKTIDENMHGKINEWARNEGNWDKDSDFIGYKRVLCIGCQIEHDIFQKRIGSEKK